MVDFRLRNDQDGQTPVPEPASKPGVPQSVTRVSPRHPRPSVDVSRVCLLIGQLGLGGTEKQVVLLAQGLRARGIETTVCLLFAGGPREEALRAAGVPVVHLGFPSSTAWLRT